MSEDRGRKSWAKGERRLSADDALAADLGALRSASASGLPPIDDLDNLANRARTGLGGRAHSRTHTESAAHAASTRGGKLVSALQFFKARPAFAAALTVATVSFVLLFIPFSYERTVGNDVTLTLAGPGLDRDAVGAIADEFSASIGSDDARVMRIEPLIAAVKSTHGGATAAAPTAAISAAVGEAPSPALAHPAQYRIKAFTPTRSQDDTQRAATLFASKLAGRGIDSRAQVTPRRERVEGNMYAVANESVCKLTIDNRGKTAEEMEADIRSQLEAACGAGNADVDVTLDGDMTQVQISCGQEGGCLGDASADCREECEINLVVEGEDGVAHPIIIRPDASMTQEQIQALIEEQLRAQGITATPEVKLERTQTADGEQCRVEVKIEKP
jgi:hypothetical protein